MNQNYPKAKSPYQTLVAAVLLLGTLAVGSARAQIFITDIANNAVQEYATDGTLASSDLFTTGGGPYGIVSDGLGDLFTANIDAGTISKYNIATNTVSTVVTGLSNPLGITYAGGNLFVSDIATSTVGEYNAVTGTAVNASLLGGLATPTGLAVSGNTLFVTEDGTNAIDAFNLLTGIETTNFITGLNGPHLIAVSGNFLYVANTGGTTIGKYNATTGAVVNASFINIPGVNPTSVSVSGSDIYVLANSDNSIYEFDMTGTQVGTGPLFTEPDNDSPIGITVLSSAPEPTTTSLLAIAFVGMGVVAFRRKSLVA